MGISSDGSVVVVGAMMSKVGDADAAGKVYVFARCGGGYVQMAKLTAPDAAANDQFGSSVAINADGSVIAACAPGADFSGGATNGGKCYVFHRNQASPTKTWALVAALAAPEPAANDGFGGNNGGVRVSDDGNIILVGVPGFADSDTGVMGTPDKAFIFFRPPPLTAYPDPPVTTVPALNVGWTPRELVSPSADKGTGISYGWMVALSGDGLIAAVGAANDNFGVGDATPVSNCGSVTVFVVTAMAPDSGKRFAAPSAQTGNNFGAGLAISPISGNSDGYKYRLVVGAPGTGTSALAGAVHTFIGKGANNGVWDFEQTLPAPAATSANNADQFGFCVGLASDSSLLVSTTPNAATKSGGLVAFAKASVPAPLATPADAVQYCAAPAPTVALRQSLSNVDISTWSGDALTSAVTALAKALEDAAKLSDPSAKVVVGRIIRTDSGAVVYTGPQGVRRLGAGRLALHGRSLQTIVGLQIYAVATVGSVAAAAALGSALSSSSGATSFKNALTASLSGSAVAGFTGITAAQISVQSAPSAPTPPAATDTSLLSTNAIIGLCVGLIGGAIIVLILVRCCCCTKKPETPASGLTIRAPSSPAKVAPE